MILGRKLFAKLSRPVEGGIDIPAQIRFDLAQGRDHIGKTYLAHDHQIHIARRSFFASCNRTVHECKLNLILKRSAAFMQNVSYSGRFCEDALQLSKNRVLSIRLIVDLVTTTDTVNEPGVTQ